MAEETTDNWMISGLISFLGLPMINLDKAKEKPKKEDIKNKKRTKITTCDIIKKHHEDMKDDPEHLTTDFIQKQIGVICDD